MARICVYCASSNRVAERYLILASQVGAELARRGHALVTGGGRVSMMGAVASAARAGGAHTVGIIPRALVDREIADIGADDLVVVDTMRERKAQMESRADAFLTLPGGIGTMEELFEIWTAKTLRLHDKPVVVLDHEGFFHPLWTFVEGLVDTRFMRNAAYEALTIVDSVGAALDAVEA